MISFNIKKFNYFIKLPLMAKVVSISIVTNIIVTSLFFTIFHSSQTSSREIVTLDILKTMDDYSALAVKNIHDPQNMKKSAHLLSKKLEEVIAINAKEKHLVIMPKQAVISGAQDITPQIEALVFGQSESKK